MAIGDKIQFVDKAYVDAIKAKVEDAVDGSIQEVLNSEIVATDIANKLMVLETEYIPRLTEVESHLAEKAKRVDLEVERERINKIVTSAGDYYIKCLSTDTGALLVVASGATTGQINIASVTPRLNTYTPVAADYVRLISNGLTAETIDMRIGANGTVYDTAGNASRNQINDLKGDLDKYLENVRLQSNLITEIIENKICSTTIGSKIKFTDNTGYGYTMIDVISGETYSINQTYFNNSFSVVCDKDGIILGKLSTYQVDATRYLMPPNVSRIYLCYNGFASSSSSSSRNIVVMRTKDIITDVTIYNTDVFPFGGEVKRISVKNLYDAKNEVFVEELIKKVIDADVAKSKEVIANSLSWETQYLNNDKVSNGYYYTGAGTKSANATYRTFDPIVIPKGTYYITSNASASFSYVKDANGVVTNFSALTTDSWTAYQTKIYRFDMDVTLYLSSSSDKKVIVSTYPLAPADYIYGTFMYNPYRCFYVGSKRSYKLLSEAIAEATKYMDSYVFVDAEVFDLVSEFTQAYLDSYSGSSMIGIFLKNRVNVIFASGAKVIFNYTGTNVNVHTYFSPFNTGEYGFELINAWVESTNCRYSVHDERNSAPMPYRNVYRGCTLIHDSSNCSWGAHPAIGGGLGCHADIIIDDCYGKAVGYESNVFSYHNASSPTETDTESKITVKNCYLEGTFRVSNYGVSDKMSKAYVSGCSLLSEPRCETTITVDRHDNMELIEWNNEIRTA